MTVAREILGRIEGTQGPAIEEAAKLFAHSIGSGGLVHLFGSGHSRMSVEELFPRIGSYVGFHPIVELSLSYFTNVIDGMGIEQAFFLERVDGFAEKILAAHEFGGIDSALVISSSGINSVPVELAAGLKLRGLPVVCITSMAHSRQTQPKNLLGKRLYEVSDIVIDSCVPRGDAVIRIDGLDHPVGAVSSLASVAIVQSLSVRTAEILASQRVKLVIMANPHVNDEQGIADNRARYLAEYRDRLRKRASSASESSDKYETRGP